MRQLLAAFALFGSLMVTPAAASAAPPYTCRDSDPQVSWQSKVNLGGSLFTDGVVGLQNVGSNYACTGDTSLNGQAAQGYNMTAWLLNARRLENTYGIVQVGVMRMDCNWSCEPGTCPHAWATGIRYFKEIETWSSTSGAPIQADCVDLGPASGNDYKVRIDYSGGGLFNIYLDTDNNGTYDITGIEYTPYSWANAGYDTLSSGVYMTEKHDGGTTVGVSTNKNVSSGLKYHFGSTWYTPSLGVNDCYFVDPSGPPSDICGTTTTVASSWGS